MKIDYKFIHEDKLKRIREFKSQVPQHLIIPIHPNLYAQESLILGLQAANLRNPSVMGELTKLSRTSISRILGILDKKGYVFKTGKNIWYETAKWDYEEAAEHAKNYYKSSRNPKGVLRAVTNRKFDAAAAEFVEVARLDEKWNKMHKLPKDEDTKIGKGGTVKAEDRKDSESQGKMIWHDLVNEGVKKLL